MCIMRPTSTKWSARVNPLQNAIIERIWRGRDPLQGLPANLFEFDIQGWNSQHPYLEEGVAAHSPSIVIEVGVWKGGSTIYMANQMRIAQTNSVVIAIDTWLGSSEHWLVDVFYQSMSFMNGYPANYLKFASNVLRAGVADHVVPLPLDSLNACRVISGAQIMPDMIHLDAAHDYESVSGDLKAWWPLLKDGGLLVGDDYATDGSWVTVRHAFDDFFGPLGYAPIEHRDGKCRIIKKSEG